MTPWAMGRGLSPAPWAPRLTRPAGRRAAPAGRNLCCKSALPVMLCILLLSLMLGLSGRRGGGGGSTCPPVAHRLMEESALQKNQEHASEGCRELGRKRMNEKEELMRRKKWGSGAPSWG